MSTNIWKNSLLSKVQSKVKETLRFKRNGLIWVENNKNKHGFKKD